LTPHTGLEACGPHVPQEEQNLRLTRQYADAQVVLNGANTFQLSHYFPLLFLQLLTFGDLVENSMKVF
jgi:hypothetical protein